MSDTTLVKMSRVEALWERLVNAALRRDRTGEAGGGGGGCPGEGRDINDILRAADELQADDPVIARICKLLLVFFFFLSVQSCDYFLFFLLQYVSMLTRLHKNLTLIVKA